MEERYLLTCTRYIELNSVRAGLAKEPEDWRWRRVKAKMKGKDDILVKTRPLQGIVNRPWGEVISSDVQAQEIGICRKNERSGRPLGEDLFIKKMESILDRRLKPQKPGLKKKDK